MITACFPAPDLRLESFSLTLSHIAVSSSKRVEWETECPGRSKKVTTFELPVMCLRDIPSNRCFGVFHCPFVKLWQISWHSESISLSERKVEFFFEDNNAFVKIKRNGGMLLCIERRYVELGGHGKGGLFAYIQQRLLALE